MQHTIAFAARMPFRFLFVTTILIAATPAAAQDIAQVPEASSFALLAMGVAGVLIGRRLSMQRKDDD